MATPITVTFSGELSAKIQHLASRRNQEISELFAALVDQALPDETDEVIDLTEPDEAVAREIAAYHALHQTLLEQYPGWYVAMHNGQLVDRDRDKVALSQRIDQRFPDDFVLLRKVEQQPERVLYFRSPRVTGRHP